MKINLIKAETTLGNDEGGFVLRFKNNPKAKPIKAVFGKRHIKLHHLIQWEQKYPKRLGI